MQNQEPAKSILAADFGSVHTRVVLIDQANGQYRLMTRARVRTTTEPPIDNVIAGLGWALVNIQEAIQRRLIDAGGLIIPENTNGEGVDELVATSSAARPLNAVLMGLMPSISINSARRALTGTYINVTESLTIADRRSLEDQINAILQAKPDLIFISGGTDGGNQNGVMQLVQLARLSARLFPTDEKPIILYAGNRELTNQVYEVFEDTGTQVHVASNIRPSLLHEELDQVRLQLAKSYSDHIVRQPGGFRDVANSTKVGVIPTAQGLTNIIRWLDESEAPANGILHIDVGSSTSTLVMSANTEVSSNIHSDLGLGHSILSTLEHLEFERILSWLPFTLTEDDLWNYAHNKALVPDTIPQTWRDMMLEQAIAREITRLLLTETQESQSKTSRTDVKALSPLIIAGAILTDTPHPGITALMALDSVESEGIIDLYADPYSILPALGAIAYTNPTAAVQVFDNEGMPFLGTSFCASGRSRQSRRPAMQIKIVLEDGRQLEHQLMPGEIWSASAPIGQQATVDIRLGRGFSISGKRRIKHEVMVGSAGIIFDARGRPVPFVPLKRRTETFAAWWQGVASGQVTYAATDTDDEAEQIDTNNFRERQREIKSVQDFITKAYHEGLGTAVAESKSETKRRKDRKTQQKAANEETEWDDLLDQL